MELELTDEKVRELAVSGASDDEICELYGIGKSELVQFEGVLKSGRAQRRIDLRNLQNEAAKKGNAAVLNQLGKHELGQGQSRGQNRGQDRGKDDGRDGEKSDGRYAATPREIVAVRPAKRPEPELEPKVG
jgi:hypothetical protein